MIGSSIFQHYCLKNHLYFGFGPAVVDVNDGEHIPAQRWRRLREYLLIVNGDINIFINIDIVINIDIDIIIDIDDTYEMILILPLAWLELIFDTVLVAFPFHLGMILWCDDDYSDDHHDLD